jgi:hypothetical protein
MCNTGRIEKWFELVKKIEDDDMIMIKLVYEVYEILREIESIRYAMSTPVFWYSHDHQPSHRLGDG